MDACGVRALYPRPKETRFYGATDKAAQGFIKCFPVRRKGIGISKINNGTFRFVIAGCRALFCMLVDHFPVVIEIGSQRPEVGCALLAAFGFVR
jgi:hypothetical protein